MSLFGKSDYERESKQNKVVSPRRASHGGVKTSKQVRLPSQYKSPNHKCSQCNSKDSKLYLVSVKETQWLCPIHLGKFLNKNISEKPNFIKASKLRVKSVRRPTK